MDKYILCRWMTSFVYLRNLATSDMPISGFPGCLQPKLTWLSDAFGHPKRQKRTYTTKVFSYLLCVIGKLNVKLYEQINTTLMFVLNSIRIIPCRIMFLITKQLSGTLINRQIRLFGTPGMCHFLKLGWLSPLSSYVTTLFTLPH